MIKELWTFCASSRELIETTWGCNHTQRVMLSGPVPFECDPHTVAFGRGDHQASNIRRKPLEIGCVAHAGSSAAGVFDDSLLDFFLAIMTSESS